MDKQLKFLELNYKHVFYLGDLDNGTKTYQIYLKSEKKSSSEFIGFFNEEFIYIRKSLDEVEPFFNDELLNRLNNDYKIFSGPIELGLL